MKIDLWQGCYSQGWGKNLIPEAFSHPAKVSFSLVAKIYDHAINEKWIKKGDLILDPFSGIGGFAFHALCYGLNFIGVELEQKFVDLGQQNIELWNRKMKGWPNLGMATIIQGDSRKIVAELWFQEFKDVIEGANLILSSPPYADWHGDDKRFGILRHKDGCKCNFCKKNKGNMGFNQGYQDVIEKADLVVSSPPFSKQAPTIKMDDEHIRQLVERTNKRYGRTKITFEGVKKNIEDSQTKIGDYGHTPGNLANLKEGNIGNTSGDTFWVASKIIVQQCYDLLKPQGHTIWVCKDYIKGGRRIPFSQRWATLCESVGFELIHWHKASLIKEFGTQITTMNGDEKIQTEKKSFFRRLAEKKGSPRIDEEDILCLIKPLAEGK